MTKNLLGVLILAMVLLLSPHATAANTLISPQIVGGDEAVPNEYPWQALLYIGGFMCGGSLIDSQWVLTASHCVEGMTAGQATVYLGLHNRSALNISTNPYLQTKSVSQIVMHPCYDGAYDGSGQCTLSSQYNYDVALLRLSSAATMTTGVQPIALATTTDHSALYTAGQILTVSGWGTTSAGGFTSSVLRKVNVPVVSNAECNTKYGGGITSLMMCAGDTTVGGIDSCQGDSGGPLFYQNGSTNVQVGIVSWGNSCADYRWPGVYTHVANVYDWINEQTNLAPIVPTATMDPAQTWTPTSTSIPSVTLTPSLTNTPIARITETSTRVPSATRTPSITRTPSATRTPSITRTPSLTATATPLLGRNMMLSVSFDDITGFTNRRSGDEGVVCVDRSRACVGPVVDGVSGQAAVFDATTENAMQSVRAVAVRRPANVLASAWVRTAVDSVVMASTGRTNLSIEIVGGVLTCTVAYRGDVAKATGSHILTDNDWHHVACLTQDGRPGTVQGFVDGSADTALVEVPGAITSARWTIGALGSTFGSFAIDELRVGTGPVGINNVVQLYNEQVPDPLAILPTITPTPSATATPSRTPRPSLTPRPSRTPRPSLTPTQIPVWQTAVANGNFESGHTAWSEASTHYATVIENNTFVKARSGTYYAWFGGTNKETSLLQQTITVPHDAQYLRMYYLLKSDEKCGAYWDTFTVNVDGTAIDTKELCDANQTTRWRPYTIDLSAYAGSTIELTLRAETDVTVVSSIWIDDVGFVQHANQALNYYRTGSLFGVQRNLQVVR